MSSNLIEAYRARTPSSRELHERAKQVLPSGVTHDSRYMEPHPIYVTHASGSHKWDVDGHEYVDYSGGHGALLLGHNHPHVMQAVSEQLSRGTHYGACHELELRWAELVKKLVPSAEMVRFTASGTEATLLAVRLARAYIERPKILRFFGHFHGWHDHMAFGVSSHFDGTPTPGVLPGVASQVVLAPPNDLEKTGALLAKGDIAAVIIEPTGASWGQVPVTREFLAGLRELCSKHGALLIFDEVISGFRCAPGGAQALYGIMPDLTTLAKVLAGGLPGGAVAGRRSIMAELDFGLSRIQGREKIPHQGTFNANPLSAAAGVATLELIANSDVCQRANDYADRLRQALTAVLEEEKVPWVVYGSFSGFHIYTNPDRLPITAADMAAGKCDYKAPKTAPRELSMCLRLSMLVHGVDIFGWPGGPTSAVHTDDDLHQTAKAFRGSLRMLRDAGLLDHDATGAPAPTAG